MEERIARLEESVSLYELAIARLEASDPDGPLVEQFKLIRASTLDAIEQIRADAPRRLRSRRV